jgi:Domain of unknown function (DUF4349)
MNRKLTVSLCVALAWISTGCARKMVSEPRATTGSTVALAAAPQRFIAERQKLVIITPEAQLQKAWESAIAFCGTIQCEVLSCNISTPTGDSMPSGEISLRVVPQDLNNLLAHVQTLGKIAQHTTQREDKTTQIVDTEAKIKNLTTFRDNLRAMLAKPSATVRDLVEIQKQLTDTQSELDSETAQRKILANETEKIEMELSFRVEGSGSSTGFRQIWNALRESGDVLADSTSSLITTIVAVIPWLVLIVPGVWLTTKGWKKLKLRRSRATAPPPGPATI